jgi:TonB family protein
MSFLLDSTLKVSLIVLVALGATILLRRRSAAARHWVLAVAIACAAASPLLGLIMPSWRVHLGTFPDASQVERVGSVVSTTTLRAGSARAGQAPLSTSSRASASSGDDAAGPTMFAALGLWCIGAGISVMILLVGLVRLKWLASRARRVEEGRWVDLTKEIAGAFGLRRTEHASCSGTSWRTSGVGTGSYKWRLKSFARSSGSIRSSGSPAHVSDRKANTPAMMRCWTAPWTALITRATCWIWHALSTPNGARGSPRWRWLVRPALEGRIRAMLSANVNRTPLTLWSRLFTVIALVSLTLPIAGLGGQRTFFTVSGSVLDGTNRVLPNVTVVLTNTSSDAKREVRSDSTGRFEFEGVSAGDYVLEAGVPGFATFRDQVTVVGRNIDRNIELQVGSLEETITVSDRGGQKPSADQAEKAQLMRRRAQERAQERMQRGLEKCSTGGPIGGNILAPLKLVDVKPEYPENLKDAKVGGVVVLEAVIGTDGRIQDVQVMNSPDPTLGNAAVEAVRQWQFSATLLNCTPIEVQMQVSVNFTIQP